MSSIHSEDRYSTSAVFVYGGAAPFCTLALFGTMNLLLCHEPALTQADPSAPDLAGRLEAMEQEIDAKRKEYHVPGLALAIVKDDQVIYAQGLGQRDLERRLPVTPQTLFAIGSCTKAFTALAVMMCVDEGKLSLDDSPKKFLPYFKLSDPEADSKITLADLLCHRSGLDRTDMAWYTGKLKPKDVIRVAGMAKPTAKLGEKFQYQNVMYLALGEVIAQVQGASWRRFLARRIFRPLGMKSTNTSRRAMQRAFDHALGYLYREDARETLPLPMRDLSNIAPAGAINSNAQDMGQWLRLMLAGGMYGGQRLISEKSFAELLKPHVRVAGPLHYGFGWMLSEWEGHPIAEHGGGIDGFTSLVSLMPDQKLGFALLTNLNGTPLMNLAAEIIWRNLVEVSGKPSEPGVATQTPEPASDPAQEEGIYQLAEPKLTATVALQEGKLTLTLPGQPTYPLQNVGGRRYRLGDPAPPEVFATFRAALDDPEQAELVIEQSGMTFVLRKEKAVPFTDPFTVEELMQKRVEAQGGEANLRRHRSLIVKAALDLENEGLTGYRVLYWKAPNCYAEKVTLYGLGKKIATMRDYFDGAQGGTESDFTRTLPKTGKDLADAALAAHLWPELDWKTLFQTVAIKGVSKVGEEEVWVVEKLPEKGTPVADYVSPRSFLLLKQDRVGGASATFSDYRPVGGVLLPFRSELTGAGQLSGKVLVTVREAKFDVRIPDSVFQPRVKGEPH